MLRAIYALGNQLTDLAPENYSTIRKHVKNNECNHDFTKIVALTVHSMFQTVERLHAVKNIKTILLASQDK